MSQGPAPDALTIERSTAMDQDQGEAAITSWLEALGSPASHPQLAQTPSRVWQCWTEDLLNGYQMSAASILQEQYPVHQAGLVVVRDIQLHGMCPHHLLPFVGRAHIAYLPKDSIVGFSKLCELVACFSRRLTLQETVTQQIPQALMEALHARGAGCVIEAKHMCLTLRDPAHHQSTITTSSFLGELQDNPVWQQTLLRP